MFYGHLTLLKGEFPIRKHHMVTDMVTDFQSQMYWDKTLVMFKNFEKETEALAVFLKQISPKTPILVEIIES